MTAHHSPLEEYMLTALRSVEEPVPYRITAENCDLSEENRGRLTELLEKHVPGISRVALHPISRGHFTLTVKFSPEAIDKFDVLTDMVKKLHHFIPDQKNAKFHINVRKPIEDGQGYTVANGSAAVSHLYPTPVQPNTSSSIVDSLFGAILTTMGAIVDLRRMF